MVWEGVCRVMGVNTQQDKPQSRAPREVRVHGGCCGEQQPACVHGLVRACTPLRVLRGDTHRCQIKCQVLWGNWDGRCSCPACWGCLAPAHSGERALAAAPHAGSPARLPVSPSALPDRPRSQELLPGAVLSLPATQRASPPPPSLASSIPLASSIHGRARRSRWDAPEAAAGTSGLNLTVTPSWKKPS